MPQTHNLCEEVSCKFLCNHVRGCLSVRTDTLTSLIISVLYFSIFNNNNRWYICIYQIKVVPLHIDKGSDID